MLDSVPASKPPDPRHLKRVERMKQLFAYSFRPEAAVQTQIEKIVSKLDVLDKQIKESAPERPLSDINRIDLAILRLAVFESESSQTPKKVIIDEAIELAKEFGSENSPKFVNGVLHKIFKFETKEEIS